MGNCETNAFDLYAPPVCTGPEEPGEGRPQFLADHLTLSQPGEYIMPTTLILPCPFTGHEMFCAGPNILSQPKNLTEFSASSKTFVLAQKPILLNANHLFVWHKMFVTATICK